MMFRNRLNFFFLIAVVSATKTLASAAWNPQSLNRHRILTVDEEDATVQLSGAKIQVDTPRTHPGDKKAYPCHCLRTIYCSLNDCLSEIKTENDEIKFASFVTLSKTSSGEIKGCTGHFDPRPWAKGIAENSIQSAFKDNLRWNSPPPTRDTIVDYTCNVSVLFGFEDAADIYDWIWGTHGIIIKFTTDGQTYSGVFLPEVPKEHFEKHDDVLENKKETLRALVLKAGYSKKDYDLDDLDIQLRKFRTEKISAKFDDCAYPF